MSFLEAVAEIVRSVWDADRTIREESAVGESEFERRNGAILKVVLGAVLIGSAGLGLWWLFR